MNPTIDTIQKNQHLFGSYALTASIWLQHSIRMEMGSSTALPEHKAGERYRGSGMLAGYINLPDLPTTATQLRVPMPCFRTSSTPCSAQHSLDVVLKVFHCQAKDFSVTFLTISFSNIIVIEDVMPCGFSIK